MGGESGKRGEGRGRHGWRPLSTRRGKSTPLAAPQIARGETGGVLGWAPREGNGMNLRVGRINSERSNQACG